MSRIFASFVGVLAVAWMSATPLQAQTRPIVKTLGPDFPKSEMFIGNSFFYYNNGLPGHLSLLEKAADPEHKQDYRATMVTIGGSGFDWHDVESYFRPDAIGRYSFDDHNNVVFNKPGKQFDAAVMMDCSQCPIHPTLKPIFTEYAKKDSDIVRAHGAIPVFFMSWAYADKPEMTAQLAEAYTVAGNANNALVIPAGLAFARALANGGRAAIVVPDKALGPVVDEVAQHLFVLLFHHLFDELGKILGGDDVGVRRFLRRENVAADEEVRDQVRVADARVFRLHMVDLPLVLDVVVEAGDGFLEGLGHC